MKNVSIPLPIALAMTMLLLHSDEVDNTELNEDIGIARNILTKLNEDIAIVRNILIKAITDQIDMIEIHAEIQKISPNVRDDLPK